MTRQPIFSISPINQDYNYYVFVETLGSNKEKDFSLLQNLIEKALEGKVILDGSLAETDRELNNLWQIREDVSILDSNANYAQHFDISIPTSSIGSIIDKITNQLLKNKSVKTIFPFGHVAHLPYTKNGTKSWKLCSTL